jgi:hypothetical protein
MLREKDFTAAIFKEVEWCGLEKDKNFIVGRKGKIWELISLISAKSSKVEELSLEEAD